MVGRATVGSGQVEDRAVKHSGAGVDEAADGSSRRALDAVLATAVVLLGIVTIGTLAPGQHFAAENAALDVTLNTLTAVAAAGAAALAWIRYRIDHEVAAIYESSAFLILCITRGLIVGIATFGSQDQLGMSLDAPQQWPLYAWSLARLASAVLLIVAASSSLRGSHRMPVPTWAVQVGPLLGLLALFLILRSIEPQLPPLLGSSGLAALRGVSGSAPGMEPLGLALQATTGVSYLIGAVLYRQIARERGRRYASYIAIALVVATFSQLHWAIFPGIYRPLVSVDDLLRTVFSIVILLGIEAQFRGDVQALRLANARLRGLRETDAERAGLEASARLARELHDGLSQDLWLAKMQHARLVEIEPMPPVAKPLLAELGDAVDRALGDSRSIVASLRSDPAAVSFGDAMQRTVAAFEDRTGIRTAVTGSGPLPRIRPVVASEINHIVREALANVARHADATTVTVATRAHDGAIEVSVIDNGRGFDPDSVDRSTFGLQGMQERAALIGAHVRIVSRPADGTRVVITVPLAPPEAGSGG